MGYRVEDKRNGNIYVYRVESYWDKTKKQARQKRTYLGRKDEATGEVKTKRTKIPIGSHNIGALHLLKSLCQNINLVKVLKKTFPYDFEKILHLACFKIIKKEPYYLYKLWCEESYVSNKNTLSPIDVSDLLSEIGRDEKSVEMFFKEWIKEFNAEASAVMFDITSISSYGTRNDFLERGYNRDKEDLEQVNLGLVSKKTASNVGLPLAYRVYPRSITDVITLKNMTDGIKQYGLNLDILVMDKGFYSQENIKDMNSKGLKYLIPMSFSTKLSKEILINEEEDLLSLKNSFVVKDEVYSHTTTKITIAKNDCVAHIFLDKKRRTDQESMFIKKISSIENTFKTKKFANKEDILLYLEETLKSKKKFFSIKESSKNKFELERNIEVFEKEILKMGVMILITNDFNLKKEEVLDLYRKKDTIEKIFLSYKHDINEKRSRTHSLIAMRGSLFINFVSLIIITLIDQVMKDKELYKKMTKKELYKILDRLKLYELATGKTMLGEMSKKQKDILNAFNVNKNVKPSTTFG